MVIERAKQNLYRMLMFCGICGFEIAAGLTSLADTLSTPVSVAVRLFVACCSLVAILLDFGKVFGKSRRLILGFCLFWFLYSLRIGYATTFSDELLAYPAWYYYTWSIGACALPMIGLSLWSPRYEDANRNFKLLFTGLIIGGSLASFGASPTEVNLNYEVVETGRMALTALNPILLGQLGATLTLMSVWVLTTGFKKYSLVSKFLFLAFAILGAGLLIGANSRGPIFSVTICLIFISLASNKRSRFYAITVLIIAIVSFMPLTKYFEEEFGVTTYTRLFEQSQLQEENTLDRLSRYKGAINAFSSNPILGSNLEEPTIGGYPHNLFIETLMSLGIFGFMLLFTLLVTTFSFAIKLYVRFKEYGWVSILFIQYLVASQFSGAIYTVNYLWISAGFVVAIYSSLTDNKTYRNIQHKSESKSKNQLFHNKEFTRHENKK